MRKLFVLAGLAAVVGLLALPESGASANDSVLITVPGTAAVYFAGQSQSDLEAVYPPSEGWAGVPWDAGGGGNCDNFHNDTAPWVGVWRAQQSPQYFTDRSGTAVVPPSVEVCGDTLSISASGEWGHGPAYPSGPGGKNTTNVLPHSEYDDFGISLVNAPLNTLVGVFLTDDPPSPPAPSTLTVGVDSMTAPDLQQAFAIGGSLADITIPDGATRLFFGLQDGFEWWNNAGSVEVTVSLNCVFVDIDIKPGSYPNCINPDGHGVIPVAILTTESFDATTVDPATVELEGAGVAVKGKSDKMLAAIEDVDGDGDLDLVVKIVDDTLLTGLAEATLTGNLFDGTPIEGTDSICIVPPS